MAWRSPPRLCRRTLPTRWAAYLSLGMALLLFGFLGTSQGIYVQF